MNPEEDARLERIEKDVDELLIGQRLQDIELRVILERWHPTYPRPVFVAVRPVA